MAIVVPSSTSAGRMTGLVAAYLNAVNEETTRVQNMIVNAQSGAPFVVVTTVSGGPYSAGTTQITVASAAQIYPGAPIQLVMSDATTFNTVAQAVAGSTITLAAAVPAGKTLATGSNFSVQSTGQQLEGTGNNFGVQASSIPGQNGTAYASAFGTVQAKIAALWADVTFQGALQAIDQGVTVQA